jgi:hypothetical protein
MTTVKDIFERWICENNCITNIERGCLDDERKDKGCERNFTIDVIDMIKGLLLEVEEMVRPELTYGDTPYLSNAVRYGKNEYRQEILDSLQKIRKEVE